MIDDSPVPDAIASRLEKAWAIARERGGKLLSADVPNAMMPLSWECAEGHRWSTTLQKVKTGTWCPNCAGICRLTIEDMRFLAAERSGKCLSTEYVNNATPLQWRCFECHEWWAKPGAIRRSWCPFCARTRKLEIRDLRRIARSRGGILLSTEYVNCNEPLQWRCGAGHVWAAAAKSVKASGFKKGSWCPLCPRRNKGRAFRLSIEEMQQIARTRGGACVSKVYFNSNTHLIWRCSEGHEWEAKPSCVKYGTWCPVCAGAQKLTLEDLSKLAAERGGKLLSKEYVDSKTDLTWQCSLGHQWQAAASRVKYGTWCPVCGGTSALSIEEMRELALSRGGECLSKRYVNNITPLKWRCALGHVWFAVASMVKPSGFQEKGTWCPVCTKVPKYTLEEMRQLAASRGGKCLSNKYINGSTPLKWLCAKGHSWSATQNSVQPSGKSKGTWCSVCAVEAKRLTIEDMRALASARGGACLSLKYGNSRTPLRWRCAEGHEWSAKPNHVRPYGQQQKSSWCPICAGRHS